MKNYLNLAIRVNIAVLLITILLSAIIMPAIITGLLVTGTIDSNPALPPKTIQIVIETVALAVIIFGAAYWSFKSTYSSMKKSREIVLSSAILYSLFLKIAVDIIYALIAKELNLVNLAIAECTALLAFYLGGKSEELKTSTNAG